MSTYILCFYWCISNNGMSFILKKGVSQLGTNDEWTSRGSIWFITNYGVYTLHLQGIGAMLFDFAILWDPLLLTLCFHNMEATATVWFHLGLFLKSHSFSSPQAFPLDSRIFTSDITRLCCFVFEKQSKVYVKILQISFGFRVERTLFSISQFLIHSELLRVHIWEQKLI